MIELYYYFKLKCKMFIMRLFDWFVGIMKADDDISWYVDYATGANTKIMLLENKIDFYERQLLQRDAAIRGLEEELYYYESLLEEESY